MIEVRDVEQELSTLGHDPGYKLTFGGCSAPADPGKESAGPEQCSTLMAQSNGVLLTHAYKRKGIFCRYVLLRLKFHEKEMKQCSCMLIFFTEVLYDVMQIASFIIANKSV